MDGSTRATLRTALVEQYERLRTRLAAKVGSRDLASEALHEMWLKLSEGADLAPVADPDAYVFRGALNAARDLEQARRRLLDATEIGEILDLADDAPGADRVAEAKSELAALRRALRELKPRQRAIFVGAMYEGVDHETLAERHGIGVRMVQMDLRAAILHCAKRTQRRNLFAPGALRVSRN